MLTKQIHHRFTIKSRRPRFDNQTFVWLSFSFAFSVLCSSLALREAFSSEYVTQVDALQHIFWMRRFLDVTLFPNDLIADYFQSVAPWGYTAFYWVFAKLNIDPVYLSKLLPLVLGLITTGYCFWLSLEMFPIPMTGFLASLLLNQFLWLRADLVSATPSAFFYPIFTAFLYYFVKKELITCATTIMLLGLFYPQTVLVVMGILILRLFDWYENPFQLRKDRKNRQICLVGLGITLGVLLIYAFKSTGYGLVVTAAEARAMPEFAPDGETQVFFEDPLVYWFFSTRTGMLCTLPAFGHLIGLAAFPWLLRQKRKFPLLQQINDKFYILIDTTVASIGMFFIAHFTLFRLHLPSRYTEHSLRVVIAILASVSLVILCNSILEYFANTKRKGTFFLSLFLSFLIINPFFFEILGIEKFPVTQYLFGKEPELYDFFEEQPKDILIASIAYEIDFIPTFAQRSILVGGNIGGNGYAVPYHTGYYSQFRERTIDLINAQYSHNLNDLKVFQSKYDIDFWLLEEGAFIPTYLSENEWLTDYPEAINGAIAHLETSSEPAILQTAEQCTVMTTGKYSVLDAACIQDFPQGGNVPINP
jgi:hypothetical protein